MSKNLISNIRNSVFILLGFAFPLLLHYAVSLVNSLIILLAVLILVDGSFFEKIQKINTSKWMKSVLLLWFLYIIYFFLFGNFSGTSRIIQIISSLLLLPIFYTSSFSEKTIQKSVFAFLISMFLSSVIAIAEYYKIIIISENSLWGSIFKFGKNPSYSAFLKYTDHNVFLAFSLIISLYSLFRIRLENKYRNILLFFIPFYLFSLFTEGGKSGQLVFLFSVILFLIFLFKKNIKILLISIAGVFVFSVIVYNTSDVVKRRFNNELNNIRENKETSRNLLFVYTIDLIKENPILGYGTGSFTDVFSEINGKTKNVISFDHKTPHNNYLYVWMELGIFGLFVFLSIFYFQIKELIKKEDGVFIILFPVMFLIIMLTDSYLFSQNTLVLYLFLSIITINYQYKLS